MKNHISLGLNSILMIVVLLCCCDTKKGQEYFYAHYYDEDSIPSSYQIRQVQYENDYRTDIVLSSNTRNGLFEQTNKEKYQLLKGKLDMVILKEGKEVQQPYLTTLNDGCIDFLFDNEMDDVMATSLCFLGVEDVLIGDKRYKNVFKFKKRLGQLDGVESIVYYDTDFILLMEKYVSGYTDDYRIVRLDTMSQ